MAIPSSKILQAALSLILLSASFHSAQAQDVIVHQKPVKVRHLAGTVVDTTGATVAYAAIELRDPSDHHVIVTTFADARGKFFFADQKRSTRFDIRASLKGFDSAQYTVSIATVGRMQLRIVLTPAA